MGKLLNVSGVNERAPTSHFLPLPPLSTKSNSKRVDLSTANIDPHVSASFVLLLLFLLPVTPNTEDDAFVLDPLTSAWSCSRLLPFLNFF